MTTSNRRSLTIAMVVAALAAMLAAVAGIDARATYGARVTADEPQYLLTAQSLADDGDLDISDEIAERAYLSYHEITINRQTAILADGGEVSPHDPLLPAILALPMSLGGWWAAKFTIAVLAALAAALTVWVAVRRFETPPTTAAIVTASVFAGLPLAGYGTQVYPEMAAALATLTGFAALTAPAVGRRSATVAGTMIVLLPWLAVKYVPVAAVLALALLLRLPTRRERQTALGALVVGGTVYLIAHRLWYGGWTVYATGDHFEQTGEFSVVGTRVDLLGRSRRLIGLLVDRDFGIAAWSPIWWLLPVSIALIVRRRPAGWQLGTALVAVAWLNATFVAFTMHGWWVPGRQVVVALPVAAVGVSWFVHRTGCRRLAAGAGALGAVNWVWLAVEASTGRRTLVVDFVDTVAPPYRAWRWALPSGIANEWTDRLLLGAWAIAVAAMTLWVLRRDRRSITPSTTT